MYTTTLQDFFKPLPGELKITAKFPEATVEITQFADVKKAAECQRLNRRPVTEVPAPTNLSS